jgi:hypothetical protein
MNKLHSLRIVKVDNILIQLYLPFIIFFIGLYFISYFSTHFEFPVIFIVITAYIFHASINAIFKPYQPLYIRLYKGSKDGEVKACISYKKIKIRGVILDSILENNNFKIIAEGRKACETISVPSFELGTDLSKYVSQVSRNLESVEIDSIYKYISEANLNYDKKVHGNNISLFIYNAKYFLSLKAIFIFATYAYIILLIMKA